MPTGTGADIQVVLTLDQLGFSKNVDKARKTLKGLGDEAEKTSKHTVSSMAAASGALRSMEGSIPIRAAERFLGMLPGVGQAVLAAFPIVGGLALANVIARGATELANFVKKAQEAKDKFRTAFQEMTNASRLSNDELERANINLENQAAKLEHKPENALAAALIDARIEADKLAISADNAFAKIKALLEENKAGIFAQAMGSDSTSEAFGNILNFQKLKAEAANRRANALHSGDHSGADKAQADYEQLLKNEIAEYKRQLALRSSSSRVESVDSEGNRSSAVLTYGQQHGDQSRNQIAFQAALTGAYQEQDRLALSKENQSATKRLVDDQNAKAAQEQYKAAQEKAAREMHQRMDDQLSALKQDHKLSVNEEIDYWRSALATIKSGSTPMLALRSEINKKLAELATENRRNLERFQDKRDTGLKPEESFDAKKASEEFRLQAEEQKKAGLAAIQSQAAYEESALALQEATGHVSKLDAAQQKAAIHARELAGEIAVIQRDMDTWANAPDSPQKMKALGDDAMEKARLEAAGRLQGAQDQAAIDSNKVTGALSESLNLYVQHSKDTAGQVRDIWNGTWQDVNDQFLKMMTTRNRGGSWRRDWSNLGSSFFKKIAGTGLQRAEGALLGGLGFGGKPDGSSGNPLHVIIAGAKAMGGTVSSAVAGAAGSTGGFVSKAITIAGSLLGFANGGEVPGPGVPIMVGERGPEVFTPSTGGKIIPNHKLGGNTHNWNIDARGSHDPAAVEAAVQRGIRRAAPSIVGASLSAHREYNSRRASSKRF